MRRTLLFILAAMLLIPASILSAQESNVEIHFKLKDTLAVRSVGSQTALKGMERIFPYAPRFEERHRKYGLDRWYRIQTADESKGRALMEQLRLLPEVEKVEKARPIELPSYEVETVPAVRSAEAVSGPVNDPLYKKQWHYQNRIHPNGIDIDLEKAWIQEQGSRNIVVAVMDEGIDVNHEDLKANLWTNEAELNGKPGVDDDGNGYVDDIYGYNFFQNKGEIDPSNHGTHVAGTVAAVNNNGTGVCGVAGGNGSTSGVRLMSCQIARSRTSVRTRAADYTSDAKAFVYAADMGAVISQNSWRIYNAVDSDLIADAVNYFMKEAGQFEGSPMKGGLVVWAAANDNSSTPALPHTHPKINKAQLIVVSALAPAGTKASYSNYGNWIDVSAPGGEYSYQKVLSCIAGNRYGYMAGTSMACPHVSGIAALVVSKFQGATFTPGEAKHRILTSVDEVDRYNEGHPWQNLLGLGRVNASKALLENKNVAPLKTTGVTIVRHTPRVVSLSWPVADDADDRSVHHYRLYRSTQSFTASALPSTYTEIYTADLQIGDRVVYRTDSLQPNTSYYFAVQGFDRWGNSSEVSEVLSCRTDENAPVIYGPYRHSKFYLYEQDTVTLRYSVLTPEGKSAQVKLIDPASMVRLTETADGIELQAVAGENSKGIYTVCLMATDKEDTKLVDTLALTYIVSPLLQTVVAPPAVRPGKTLLIDVAQSKGVIELDVDDYFYDPAGLDFFYRYDEACNTDFDKYSHGMKARLIGSILRVEYEYNIEFVRWGDDNRVINVPFHLTNSYQESAVVRFELFYSGTVGLNEAKLDQISVYPTVAGQQVSIRSAEPVEKIRFYNTTGILCLEQAAPSSSVNIGNLAPGHYLVQLITSKGIVVRRIEKR